MALVRGAVFVEGVDSNCLRWRRIRNAITQPAAAIMAIPPTTPPTIVPTLLVAATEVVTVGVEVAEGVKVEIEVTETKTVGMVEVAPFVDEAVVD